MPKFRIAIIGGGPSGIAILNKLAYNLDASQNVEIYLFDSKVVVDPGSPYAIDNKYAILNRPIFGMSHYLSDAQNFTTWCEKYNFFVGQENCFLPRNIFGNYLFDQLSEASLILKSKSISFFYCAKRIANVTKVNDEKIKLAFDDDSIQKFDHVVCATGNFRIKNPFKFKNKKNFIDNPLELNKLDDINALNESAITILGSGLSACETAIIISKINPTIKITMVSHSGKLPPVRGNVKACLSKFFTIENIKKQLEDQGSLVAEDVKDFLNKDLALFNTSYEQILENDLSFEMSYQKALKGETDWYNLIGITNNIVNYCYDNLESDLEKERFRLIFNKEWIRKRIAIPLETAHELMELTKLDRLKVIKGTIKEKGDSRELTTEGNLIVKTGKVVNACGFTDKIDLNAPKYLQEFIKVGLLDSDSKGRGVVDFKTCCALTTDGDRLNELQLTGASTQGTFFFTSAIDVIDEQASLVVSHLTKRITQMVTKIKITN